MTDIVERLLHMVPVDILGGKPMLLNPDGPAAVHEIDQLRNEIINFRTEIERLRKALQKIIDLTDAWEPEDNEDYSIIGYEVCANVAHAALEGK